MVSYSVYKIMHLAGVMMIFLSLGGVITNSVNGGALKKNWRKPVSITNGLGLLLSLVGGFVLLARIGVIHGSLPGWAIAKLVIWLLFGAMICLVNRLPGIAKPLWALTLVLGAAAAYLAGNKPF